MKFYAAILSLFSTSFITLSVAVAQEVAPSGKTIPVEIQQPKDGHLFSKVLPIPLTEIQVFLAYSISWQSTDNKPTPIQIRFSTNQKDWTNWQSIHPDEHLNKDTDWTYGELMFTNKEQSYFQIGLMQETSPLLAIKARFHNPGDSHKINNTNNYKKQNQVQSRSCPCSPPDVVSREDWCPNGNCPENSNPTATVPSHLIVHHSAGTNTSSDWAAVVRSIWDFHVNTRGWSDIGYNFLVDPNGVLYVGRGDGILGAHFCGTNSKTLGFCVMGDFTNITPTNEAKAALVSLLAEKACNDNIDPLGVTFHGSSGMVLKNISGHRDGCATACPGDSFYPELDSIRMEVAAFIENCQPLSSITTLADASIDLFPNPTNNFIQVEWDSNWVGAISIDIIDLNGKSLRQKIVDKRQALLNTSLDLTHLASGIYFVQLEWERGKLKKKLVKI